MASWELYLKQEMDYVCITRPVQFLVLVILPVVCNSLRLFVETVPAEGVASVCVPNVVT